MFETKPITFVNRLALAMYCTADLSSLPKTSMINLPPYRERDVNSHKNLSTMMFNIETIRVMEVFLKSK